MLIAALMLIMMMHGKFETEIENYLIIIYFHKLNINICELYVRASIFKR